MIEMVKIFGISVVGVELLFVGYMLSVDVEIIEYGELVCLLVMLVSLMGCLMFVVVICVVK